MVGIYFSSYNVKKLGCSKRPFHFRRYNSYREKLFYVFTPNIRRNIAIYDIKWHFFLPCTFMFLPFPPHLLNDNLFFKIIFIVPDP